MPVLPDHALPEGYLLLPGLLPPQQRLELTGELAGLPAGAAGERECLDRPWCQALARWLLDQPALQPYWPADPVAVQCTLFEKSTERNWLVTPHQDLAIPVAERVEHAEMRGWSVKSGRPFVLAPAGVLALLLAVRVHLDDAMTGDGGLRIVPGSHVDGVLDEAEVRRWRDRVGEVPVQARAGDVLLMRPLALHASSKGEGQGRRRVLHFLFGPRELPFGLRWAAAG